MSKVVIDARESGTSTGRYVDKLVEHLHLLQPEEEVWVLTKTPRLEFFGQVAPRFKTAAADQKEFTFAEQLSFRHQLSGLNADLVHFTMPQQPVLYRGRTVTNIHDLTTTRFTNPSKNLPVFKVKQQVYKWVIRRAAAKAARIITSSEFTKDDVSNFAKVDPDKVAVIYHAAEAITEPSEALPALAGQRFLMYVGRPLPHKNLERLIEAHQQVRKWQPELLLVLAGKKDVNYRRIERDVQARGLGGIVFTDFISEGGLRWLYENCAAYVFPSLSEGFGLPGLEAMVHGAPVVSSDATCLPEVYGDAAHYFDPQDVQAMARAINDVLSDHTLRAELITKGTAQAAKYSWQRTAEQTLEVYRQALGRYEK